MKTIIIMPMMVNENRKPMGMEQVSVLHMKSRSEIIMQKFQVQLSFRIDIRCRFQVILINAKIPLKV